MAEKIRLGIVGACGRGASFKGACDALEDVVIQAVCDTNVEGLTAAQKSLGAARAFGDYEQMLEEGEIDAVIIGTPTAFHVPQAIAALERQKHVLCEVPAGVNMEECRQLTAAARASRGIYMMAENYIYFRTNMVITEMVRRGLFGQTYFAEGEYIHELKAMNEVTKWRRRWQTGINGNTYPTHSLGPILQWMPGDRVEKVCCSGSGHHYKDARGEFYENEDSTLTLCKMRSGGLLKLRQDMLSDRPHAGRNYQLQGTDGCFESARAVGEPDRIWLRSLEKDSKRWMNLADIEKEFIPGRWREHEARAEKSGHGGGDLFEVMDFIEAIQGKCVPPVGIDAAMDMTLPGLASQLSIAEESRWIDVPDSRGW